MAEVIKGSSRKRRGKTTTEALSTDKRKREEDDLDLNLSSDIQGIIAALQNIREKAHKDDKKKSEETIASVSSEVKTILTDAKSKLEKERQTFVKALSKSSKECENSLKDEFAKFQSVYEKFSKEKAAHLQAFEDIFSKFDNEKEKLYLRYEQQRKKEKSMLSEMEKTCADKITAAEESLKKKKKDDKSFSILRKSLGSFLDGASDDDFPADECI
ncbi:titin homolog [Papaver somniferum]|uniref:titin homolog n=1 Tax=Papaver somniferum TaxID=3469 RepID=UPI000E6F62AD|nr:titin homolog [Papaver somniferum]XP_026380559.1 titin homolog [Papaver somniferum]